MADFDFLGAETAVYKTGLKAWEREERRLFGGDAVLTELFQFKGENADQFTLRKSTAYYTNFAEQHASTLAGFLQRATPVPNLGALGTIRSRNTIEGQKTQAELIYYNVDGVGSDGSQWGAFWTGVQIRALATGHRWLLVEMPELPTVTATNGDTAQRRQPTQADVLAGHRPYLVEFAPSSVPYWEYTRGRLDCLIARVPVVPVGKKRFEVTTDALGYYVFTRKGFEDFGSAFAAGGWWLFDADKNPVPNGTGNWERTLGQIPIVPLYGMMSHGTAEFPAISRSLTMELGQLSVALMNVMSAREYDLIDGAMSVKWLLGALPEGFAIIHEHEEVGSKTIPVIGQVVNGQYVVPSIYDGSSGVVVAEAFESAIASLIRSAHEMMVRQLTSPDASGAARQTQFGENTSPLLAGIAARLEQCMNAVITFLELRAGAAKPFGVVELPDEFELAPVRTKIERTFKLLTDAGLTSPTLKTELALRAARDDSAMPEEPEKQKAVEEELLASAAAAASKQIGETMKQWTDAGVPLDFAARQAGLSEQDAAELEPEEVPPALANAQQPPNGAPPVPVPLIPNETGAPA